ncbi:hypothetical protein EB118_11965, partial [bacterium]|nr:hypothetical protein [bacterium]
TGSVTIQQNLTVTGNTTIAGNLTVGGKIITSGAVPTIVKGLGAGSSASVTVSGNDTSGTIIIVASTNTSDDVLAKLQFSSVRSGKPRVVLTPANKVSAAAGVYYDESTATASGIDIYTANALEQGKTYVFTYFIVE